MNQTIINTVLPDLIRDMAKELDVPDKNIIDIFEAMGGAELT